ncbi:hypothetical protein B296_00041432 [Ensete ventricosum]|uniref:Uncharacterized protein n=1 Tax=Ensete ventricosum TaxID=4639 RepID=A0A426ZLV2_ENSVE|nr:hypothetical protein B296_00041432 [Ensete ventricosum]
MITETMGDGVEMGVVSSIKAAALHLEELGAVLTEAKMRILMGTYALSAGYYEAYYKRAQQVSLNFSCREKVNDPLAIINYSLQVNVNLAGVPALVVPCGFVEGGIAGLPVGLQMIGTSFSEIVMSLSFNHPSLVQEKLLRVGHIFEQTLQNHRFVPPLLG